MTTMRKREPEPEIVSQVVQKAIEASTPKARYLVAVPFSNESFFVLETLPGIVFSGGCSRSVFHLSEAPPFGIEEALLLPTVPVGATHGSRGGQVRGIVMKNVEPAPSVDSNQRRPSCRSTSSLLRKSPSPVPVISLVRAFSARTKHPKI